MRIAMTTNRKPAWQSQVLPLNSPEVTELIRAVDAASDTPLEVIRDERVMAATFRALADKLDQPDLDCD